jgi:hypothetical protein
LIKLPYTRKLFSSWSVWTRTPENDHPEISGIEVAVGATVEILAGMRGVGLTVGVSAGIGVRIAADGWLGISLGAAATARAEVEVGARDGEAGAAAARVGALVGEGAAVAEAAGGCPGVAIAREVPGTVGVKVGKGVRVAIAVGAIGTADSRKAQANVARTRATTATREDNGGGCKLIQPGSGSSVCNCLDTSLRRCILNLLLYLSSKDEIASVSHHGVGRA